MGKKRGKYNQYYGDSSLKMPRSTYYLHKKRDQALAKALNESNKAAKDNMIINSNNQDLVVEATVVVETLVSLDDESENGTMVNLEDDLEMNQQSYKTLNDSEIILLETTNEALKAENSLLMIKLAEYEKENEILKTEINSSKLENEQLKQHQNDLLDLDKKHFVDIARLIVRCFGKKEDLATFQVSDDETESIETLV